MESLLSIQIEKHTILMKLKSKNSTSVLRNYILIITIILFHITSNLLAQTESNQSKEILVSSISELNSAITSAKPSNIIIMKDGIWKNATINFNSKANASFPIILRAQTSGKVILTGNSTLTFSSPYLIVDGLIFKNGSIDKGSVISFQSDNCRLTNTIIKDYNPVNFQTAYYWVYFEGSYNRMDHCLFKGKNNMNPIVQNYEENARYNRVDSCIVKDIPYIRKANGREIFRIFGYGHADQPGDDGAFFTIEYNLFIHADGEGTEIVSLKSNNNIVRYNTVIASRGGLVGRRGKNNTFEGNFILGQDQEGTTGIRIAGSNHRVVNNYISGVAEDGLRLITGEYYEKSLTKSFAPKKKDLPKYLQVKNSYFAHNTIVNCAGNGIVVGFAYKVHWPDLQMVLFPENNRFVNNLVYNCSGNSIYIAEVDRSQPLNQFTFKPNEFEGNIIYGSKVNVSPMPKGIKLLNPKLKSAKDNLLRPENNSPLINSGVDSDVALDIDGQIRDTKKDIGADEFAEGSIIHHPLTAIEVGPKWMNQKK